MRLYSGTQNKKVFLREYVFGGTHYIRSEEGFNLLRLGGMVNFDTYQSILNNGVLFELVSVVAASDELPGSTIETQSDNGLKICC